MLGCMRTNRRRTRADTAATSLSNILQYTESQCPTHALMHMHIPRAIDPQITEYRYEPWSVDDRDARRNAYTLLSLSQTCQHMRQAVLPVLWRTVTVQTLSQLEFYTILLARTPNAREVYGRHVRHLRWIAPKQQAEYYERDWLDDHAVYRSGPWYFRFQRAADFSLRNTDRQTAADIVACYSLKALEDRLCQFFAFFRLLYSFCYSAYYTALDRRMCDVLEAANGNERLEAFELRSDKDLQILYRWEPRPYCIPNLTRASLKHLSFRLTPVFFPRYWKWHEVHADRAAPFGIRIDAAEPLSELYSSSPSPTWIIQACWLAAQHGLQSVMLPPSVSMLEHKVLQRLWLCLDVMPPGCDDYQTHDVECECQAWIEGLAIVRCAVRGSIRCHSAAWPSEVRATVTRQCRLFAQWDKQTAPDPMTIVRDTLDFRTPGGGSGRGYKWQRMDAVLKQTLLDILIPPAVDSVLSNVETDIDLQHILVQYHGQHQLQQQA